MATSSSLAHGSLPPHSSWGLKAQPLTSPRQMGRKDIPTGSHGPGGSRLSVCLSHTPVSVALKKRICNLYEALEIGAFRVHVKPHRPSAALSLCFTPNPSPMNPIRAAAIAVSVKIYRGVPANSEPGKFKVLGSFLRQLGRR